MWEYRDKVPDVATVEREHLMAFKAAKISARLAWARAAAVAPAVLHGVLL